MIVSWRMNINLVPLTFLILLVSQAIQCKVAGNRLNDKLTNIISFCQTSDLGLRLEVDFIFPLSQQDRGEHFTEFVKKPWGKVRLFWDLGKSSLKLNSARVVGICPGKC